jgi:DNA-binding NtrC family response regulator
MPSLRERPEDILLLATYFIEHYTSKAGRKIRNIERRTLEWLQDYDWPGNIRELLNVVERAVILCDDGTLDRRDLAAARNAGDEGTRCPRGDARESEMGND